MKKLLPSIVFLALCTGVAAVYLYEKGHRGGSATGTASEWLPADTQVFLSVPDLDAAVTDWQTTDLYKIWTEPEVRDFLVRPLSKLPSHKDLDEALTAFARLSPTNIFVAVTALDEKTNEFRGIAGFDFRADQSDVEKLLAGPKDAVRKKAPAGKADLNEYAGHAIETFDDGKGNILAAAFLDHRYLIANDLALLRTALDRCDHRVSAGPASPTLDKDADFQTILGKLPATHATFAFVRPRAAVHHLFDLMVAAGQPVDDARRSELDKLRAIGATTAIEQGKLRDTIYCLAPGLDLSLAKLRLGSVGLTSSSTLLYAAAMFDLPAGFALPTGTAPDSSGMFGMFGMLGSMQNLGAALNAQGLTVERFRAAFGNEMSFQMDWMANRQQPGLLATVDVRDRVAAGKFVDDLTKVLSAGATWEITHAGGLTLHSLSPATLSYISPTYVLTDKSFVLGLDPDEVNSVLLSSKTTGPDLTSGDAYKNAMGMVASPNMAFGYLDSARLFDRVYSTLRGVALLGAALVYPQLNEYVDLGKLPSAQAVTKHLSPTIFSQRSDAQGTTLESVGSFTLGQAALVFVGGASAAAFPALENQLGGSQKSPAAVRLPVPRVPPQPGQTPDPATPSQE